MNQLIKTVKRIIVIDLLYLGDLIFATPFFMNLRKLYPDARIDLIMNDNFYKIMENNPYLNNVYPYNKKFNLKDSVHFAKKLSNNHYNLGLNIHGSWRSVILLKIIHPEFIVGFGKGIKRILMNKELKPLSDNHMVDVYLNFLQNLGFPIMENSLPEIHVPTLTENQINDYLKSIVNEKYTLVGLNTGGSWPTKQWTKEAFAKLADQLQLNKDIKVIFLGGICDIPRVESIINLMSTTPLVATGKTSLTELAALLKKCDLVISGDSGPVHVAAAVGTPTITLFGPSDEKKYKPYGEGHKIITSSVPCRPCGKHKCPYDHHKCMNNIDIQTVLEQAEIILNERNR